jgi:hypothetical protein
MSTLPEDARLARWMERAASHQTRALVWLRRARDPAAGPVTASQRRDFLMRALEHILTARRLLRQSKEGTTDTTVIATLDTHLARLDGAAQSTERLLEELDGAAEG